MEAFFGEFPHTLDDKGRLVLPAKHRAIFEEGAVIAAGQAKCLAVYTPKEWEFVVERTKEMARNGGDGMIVARTIFALASPVVPDKQWRVSIPQSLREHAGLDREVVVIGNVTHIEIWDKELWAVERARGQALLSGDESLPGIMV